MEREPELEPWRPKDDPRLMRVLDLERSGDTGSAARLLRILLASLDPNVTKPKLHAHLAKLEQRCAEEGALEQQLASETASCAHGTPLARTHSARALAAAERQRRQTALAAAEAERTEHAGLDSQTRILRQAIAVFNAGAELAGSLEAAGFHCFEQSSSTTPRRRGTHGQWFQAHSGILVEIDPAIAGGISITVPWSRFYAQIGSGVDDNTAEKDLAEWIELTLASDSSTSSFGTNLLQWLDDYTHLNSANADAAVGAERRMPESGEIPAVDVGLSRLPTAAALGADEGRDLTIYTWGDALSTKAALRQLGSQLDVNAKPLNGRGGGANTRYNALQDTRILRNVVSSMCEGTGALMLKRTVRAIEADDMHTISVFCTKGRHRSVSMAEALRARYYPKAEVKHLTIK